MVLLWVVVVPGWSQVVSDNSNPVDTQQLEKEKEISRLKTDLQKKVSTVGEADSLLTVARELNYAPGQVIAFCQLAMLHIQQQETEEAKKLFAKAEEAAGQIQDVEEGGWALGIIGRIQHDYRKTSPEIAIALSKVMTSVGGSMKKAAKGLGKKSLRPDRTIPVDISIEATQMAVKKRLENRSSPAIPTDYLSSIPIPTYDPGRNRSFRIKPEMIDRWVDTLINSSRSNPKVVEQLTTRKKLRDSTKALSKAFAKEGDYAQAYRYFLQYSAYKDSLTAEATTRRLASLEYRQNLLKKEAQIQLLTKDRQLRDQESHRQRQYVFILIGCIALLVGFSLILTRNNRAKQRANRQLNEQKEALQQTLVKLKSTQDQLIQAEKMASLGELTAGIAHEIQNPLNFVNNFSEVSTELVTELIENRQSGQHDDELDTEIINDLQQNLQKINQHGGRASAIVKGMLEHARTSSGERLPTDLNALTDEYLKLAYHGVRARDSTFEARLIADYAPDLGPVTIVPQEVGRVLLNVFNNAFYAVQKRQQSNGPDYQPIVAVYTSQEADRVKIRIRDNGTGVPESIKLKIFQPFFTTKPTGQGTGLGLSLSYDIITKGHGGTFTLESEEGEFTELTLTLPTSI
ncbi:two-component sensor histidine kinase [Spirosoma aureum]|uniref:histidine kinase n=2 Tax=Spirosoma aureum TaxID=2692134 RepID=A0A6G9AZR1_9BACT|nr:two-component sensor histidine kinase [Spirosoma aureum]